jgi:hypothetical protein
MGGTAFPNHFTPRMSHETYSHLLSKIQEVLTHFYAHVRAPPEAPSKQDHGDVDVIVATPLRTFETEELQRALNAVARTGNSVTKSYCVPLPSSGDDGETFAQIDVHVVQNPAMIDWELFMASYGDMQQLLGLLQRPLGLTTNDRGLHVRVREMEEMNRKAAMIFLTSDVVEMLEFLGLDVGKWEKGFESNEEVFEWCLRGRFWGEKVVTDILAGRHRETEDGVGMHSGDRQRMRKRAMFRACVDEFLPQYRDLWMGKRDWNRKEILEETLKCFGVREEYDKKVEDAAIVRKERELLEVIKKAIPEEGERLGEVMKGFKRWVRWENGKPIMCNEGEEIGDKPKWLSLVKNEEREGLLKWLTDNHQELRRREKERASRMRKDKEVAKKDGLYLDFHK